MTLLRGDCDNARRCSRRLNPRPRRELRCALNCRRLQPSPIQNRQQLEEIANLSLFAAFTAALFSSSAVTISVWPFLDARCSAVFLHGADKLNHESNGALNRRRVQPSPMQHRQQGNAHLLMFSAFASAPFSSSAFTLSVWPLEDARCSAVLLHGADMLDHESNGAQPQPCRRMQPCPI
jgi:hypothetical protein